MKQITCIINTLLLLATFTLQSQSVGIGTDSPDSSAILDIESTSKGILIPRMSSSQRTTINDPVVGLLVFDTDTESFWFNGSNGWLELNDKSKSWNLEGNSGTDSGDFIGTTDEQDLNFKVKNKLALRLEYALNTNEPMPYPVYPNVIAGADNNSVMSSVFGASIGGGGDNSITGKYGTIGGGVTNVAVGFATVAGGVGNHAGGENSFIGGGFINNADGEYSSVIGGRSNIAEGANATVAGGVANSAYGYSSFAAGYRSQALHDGAFVWADSTSSTFFSTGPDQFLIRANGGVGIGTNSPEASLHVSGTLKIQDGSEGFGKVLVSDSSGLSSWVSQSTLNPVVLVDSDSDTKIQVEESTDEDQIRFDISGSQAMIIDSSGKIGIGVESPVTVLDIARTGESLNLRLTKESDDYGSNLVLKGGGTHYKFGTPGGVDRLRIWTDSIGDVITFLPGGNVGIGTTSPDTTLHIVGSIKMEDGTEGIGKVMISDTNGIASWTSQSNLNPVILIDVDGDTKIQVQEGPDDDVIRFDMAGTEFFRMDSARFEVLNSGQSVFIGEGAGANDDLSYNQNVFVGCLAGNANTTGNFNTAIGMQALFKNTTGVWNTAIGWRTLLSNITGNFNTAIGLQALSNNTTGGRNSAIGMEALFTNTTGSNNTALGYQADVTFDSLTNATAIGYNAKVATSNSMVLGGTGANAVKVGIGTQSPDTTLHIVGSIKMEDGTEGPGKVMISDANGTASWTSQSNLNPVILIDADGDTKIQIEESADDDIIRFDISGSQAMIIDSSGKIGIGVGTPGTVIDIAATGEAVNIRLTKESDTYGSNLVFKGGGTQFNFGTPNADRLRIWNDSTGEVLTLLPGGNVGIGTTSPDAKLDVAGNAIIEGSIKIGDDGTTISDIIRETVFYNIPPMGPSTNHIFNVSVPGAQLGAAVIVNAANGMPQAIIITSVHVSTTGNVEIKVRNVNDQTTNPAGQDYHITIIQ